MKIEKQGDKVYFIYDDVVKAGDACARLIHLNPHICSRGGKLNAVVVDMGKLKLTGGMQ